MKQQKDRINTVLTIFCIIVILFIIAPLIIVVVNSFNAASYNVFPLKGFSIQWYEKMAGYSKFLTGAKNSIITGLCAVGLGLLIGIPASYALARGNMPGKNLVKSFIMLPLALPKIVLGLAMYIYFVQLDLYNTITGLSLCHTLLVLPYIVVMVTSAIKNIERQQEEAAMDLGAKPFTAFSRILVPQIAIAVTLAAALGFIVSFDQVEASLLLVRSTNYTLPIEMMIYMEKYQDPTIAALSTVLLTAVIGILAILILALRKKGDVVKILASSQKKE